MMRYRYTLVSGAIVGITTVTGIPSCVPCQARARAWFPALAAMTPRFFSSCGGGAVIPCGKHGQVQCVGWSRGEGLRTFFEFFVRKEEVGVFRVWSSGSVTEIAEAADRPPTSGINRMQWKTGQAKHNNRVYADEQAKGHSET